MVMDAVFLGILLVAFFITFCGFLHKTVKNTCRKENRGDRMARRQVTQRNSADSFSEVYVNSAYQPEIRNDTGIFPAAPPPYSQNYVDPPPKYEDVIKIEDIDTPTPTPNTTPSTETANSAVARVHTTPPPYTITT